MSPDAFVLIEHLRGQVTEITYVMLAAARANATTSGGKVVGVLLGQNARGLAGGLAADQIYYVDDPQLAEFTPNAYAAALGVLLTEKAPRLVLLGHTSVGADVAGLLSSRLQLPLISSCLRLTPEGKILTQICGGKILAEIDLPSPAAILTMTPGGHPPQEGRAGAAPPITDFKIPSLETSGIRLVEYVEPDTSDVDISKETVLISVGRGIQNADNIALFDDLAAALGGVVTGSRPIIDQGWLATSRLVGKSGKHVKPKLYFAAGISGAPEHVEAITGSDTIVAINTDAAAPIFDLAQYGIDMDMFDLVEVLTTKVREAKAT